MQVPRASRISEAEWNTRRQKLERLYLDDNLSRQEIIEIMTREDDFFATEKQLKYQFNNWGLKKYISNRDLTTMLSVKRKRQELGKDTAFECRGHLLEQERLERASKRRKGPLISSPVLPPYIRALVSPRQSPQMTCFPLAHRQNFAVLNVAEKATHSVEKPVSQNLLSNDSCHQSGDFGLSDMWNSLDASSDPAFLDDGEQNQANSGLWETLLENGSVTFSPRRGSFMPTPSRPDIEAMRTEHPSRLMRSITSYVTDAQTANDNDFPLSDFDLGFDFSMFENPSHGSSRARSSSSHAETYHHRPDERMSISPLRLTDLKDTHGEHGEITLVSRTTSAAGLALGPVTGEDLRAESIASLLGLLKHLVFPRFDTASQKYEYENSVLSDVFCPRWCEWLCYEIDELLDSYLEGSLRAIRKRRIVRNQGTLPSGSDPYLDDPRKDFESSDETQRLSESVEGTVATKLRTTLSRCCPTPMGLVVFQVREAPRDSSDEVGINSKSLITISFMPRAIQRTLGLCARLSGLVSGPAISRQINTFNVIPDDSAIIQCICKNDLRGVQTLFDLGAASARDVDSRGISLLQYAMYRGSFDISKLLLQGGASTYECDDSGRTTDVITIIWSDFADAHSGGLCAWSGISVEKMRNFEQCVKITQLALDNGCTYDNAYDQVIAAGPIFALVGSSMRYAHTSATVDAIKYLLSISWDLEEQNSLGQTPLLHAAAMCQPPVARCLKTLIERGARLDARDKTGRGPLHCALSPPGFFSDSVDLRYIPWSNEDLDSNNSKMLSLYFNTEDDRYAEDYYDRESTLDSLTTSTSPDTSRSTLFLDGIGSNQLVCDYGSDIPTEQPTSIDLSSDPDSDASSCAEECISEFDENEYVYCADEWGEQTWIRNPAHVLKDRVRTKLKILLEAGCDPNDLDDNGESPSDYARQGLWPQWLWALERTGYVFDEEQDRWIKKVASA